jgi:hypothetical protein
MTLVYRRWKGTSSGYSTEEKGHVKHEGHGRDCLDHCLKTSICAEYIVRVPEYIKHIFEYLHMQSWKGDCVPSSLARTSQEFLIKIIISIIALNPLDPENLHKSSQLKLTQPPLKPTNPCLLSPHIS